MEIVTNDMIPDGKFKNKYEAIKSIRECLKMLTEIRNKTSFVKIVGIGECIPGDGIGRRVLF